MKDALLNVGGAIKLARIMAKSAGLNVKFHEDNRACTDGKTIFVPYPPVWDHRDSTKSSEELVKWYGYMFHEIKHNMPGFSDCMKLHDNFDISENLHMFNNVMEDYRMEHGNLGEFKGVDMYLSATRGILAEAYDVVDKEASDLEQAFQALYSVTDTLRGDWQPHMAGVGEEWTDSLPAKAQEWRATIIKDYGERIDALAPYQAEEALHLTSEIMRDVFGIQEEPRQKESGDGEGEGGEGEESEGNQGDTEGQEGSENQGKQGGKQENADGDEQTEAVKRLYEVMTGKADDHKSNTDITYENMPTPNAHYTIGIDRTRLVDIYLKDKPEADSYHTLHKTRLSSKVKKLLQNRTQCVYTPGYRRGKLDTNNLFKAVSGDPKVFMKKEDSLNHDVAVQVLCDMSGSMSGHRIKVASSACASLVEILQNINIPVEVLGFDDDYGVTHTWIAKEFSERLQVADISSRCLKLQSHGCGGNNDSQSLLNAYTRIAVRPETRKLIIVFSDGQPVCGFSYSPSDDLKTVCEKIEKSNVELYGIGIEIDSVKDYYKDYTVLKRVDDLEAALFDVIKKRIIK